MNWVGFPIQGKIQYALTELGNWSVVFEASMSFKGRLSIFALIKVVKKRSCIFNTPGNDRTFLRQSGINMLLQGDKQGTNHFLNILYSFFNKSIGLRLSHRRILHERLLVAGRPHLPYTFLQRLHRSLLITFKDNLFVIEKSEVVKQAGTYIS